MFSQNAVFDFNYTVAGPVIREFHETTARVRCLQGPVGSGKTTACVWEVLRRSGMQKADKSRRRKTKWIVIKNSYRQMWLVVMPLWFKVFPRNSDHPDFKTHFKEDKMIHSIELRLPDNTFIDMEVYFISADRANEETFKGINATAIWVCEASDVPSGVINMATTRWARYPEDDKGDYCGTWHGMIMDTNPPDYDDWLYKMFQEHRKDGWIIFKQPSGLSPQAENMRGKASTYYHDLMPGKSQAWIDIFVHGKEGFTLEGKVIFPEWNDDIHCSRSPIRPLHSQIIIGVDYGLTPGAIFLQQDTAGRIVSPAEITLENAGVIRLADAIKSTIARRFPDHISNDDVVIYGDPAGNNRSANDEKAAIDILRAHTGYRCYAAPTNGIETRLEAVRRGLTRLVDGKPGFIIDSECKMLRKGFNGKYHYRKIKGTDGRFDDVPNKNEYSHIQDALQYGLLGMGQARELMQTPSKFGIFTSDQAWDQTNQQLAKEADWRYSW